MKILILGDVVGEPGRRLMEAHLPDLRRDHAVDFMVVNGENAAIKIIVGVLSRRNLSHAGRKD